MAVSYRVASRYAKSLIELAQENNILDAVTEDMKLFSTVSTENRDFSLMLSSPIIPSGKKLEIINQIFSGKVNDLTSKFFALVIKKGRESDLQGIAKAFQKEYELIKGITRAKVKTAVKLSVGLRSEIESLVAKIAGGKIITIEEEVDENLIGGYVLTIGDKQLDSSVKSILQKAKNQFTK